MSSRREFWANRPFPAKKLLWGLLLLLGALAFQWASRSSPRLVEELYSRSLYPWAVGALAAVSRLVPFSLAEAGLTLAILAVGAQVWVKVRSWMRGDRSLGNILAGTIASALFFVGIGFSAFLLLWGLNYSREPLGSMLEYPGGPVQAGELAALRGELARSASELRGFVNEDARGVASWKATNHRLREEAQIAVESWMWKKPWSFPFKPSVKFATSSPALSTLGITGIYCPFTGESHGNEQVPDVEKPFVLCHEIAHAYGFAREDEANFVAAMACREHLDPFFRYSGSFCSLARLWTPSIQGPSLDGFRRDLDAVRAFWAEVRNRNLGPISGKFVMEISHKVNDGYLKSQGQKDGVQSYDRMIELLVRERRARAR